MRLTADHPVIAALLTTLLLLGGCASSFTSPFSEEQSQLYLQEVLSFSNTLPAVDMLALTDEMKAALSEAVPQNLTPAQRLTAVREFLFSEDGLNIQYHADLTKTAAETWQSRAGNCLSMTNLFVAAARNVGLPASYQTVQVEPIWNQEGATMIRYEHIVATGRLPGANRYVVDFLPEFVLGDYESEPASDNVAFALYYSNLGAEDLVDGNTERALQYLTESLRLNPQSTDAWSNIGAAFRRSGEIRLAEFSYHQALMLDGRNFSALNNLAALYLHQGRREDARKVEAQVARYRRRNPYYHYFLANGFYERGRYDEALMLLEASVRLKKDEPEFYLAMARTYARQGDEASEQKMLAKADFYRHQTLPVPQRENNHRFWNDIVELQY
ncbi:MAG: tetratricopeptide repeat protein [Pseudomonadales bacterium]|nr:tetratricopeptide repeat protein [Pseudomonadales bacterium]